MAGWFAKLMHKGARSHRAVGRAESSRDVDVSVTADERDARYDVIVQTLRDRAVDDRQAREKRQRWYREHLKRDAGIGGTVSSLSAPIRLNKFRTKVPCRSTPVARGLLDELRKKFPGSTVTFAQVAGGRQAVMLTGPAGTPPKQIGWVEHCVQTDPRLCNVRHQGLSVETDDGAMLVLRFRYPATAVRMSSRYNAEDETNAHRSDRVEEGVSSLQGESQLDLPCGGVDAVARADFTELRPALDLRPFDKAPTPRLVWITRPEAETMNALANRDYEAFYVRFKVEVLGGIWNSLLGLLSSSPGSQCHEGSYYTVLREPDAMVGKIYQKTVDDTGRAVDIGSDRIYDAFPATDILLLYLEGDILADFADIYFTLLSLGSTESYFVKEEFFAVIRRFWASSQSLASRYGSYLPTVVRMSQRALPMPAQVALLKQDWTNLRQSLVDRYGGGGRKAALLVGHDVYRPRMGSPGWSFASFPAGEVNVGLRIVYRQEWRHLGAQRGEVIPSGTRTQREGDDLRTVETTMEQGDTTRNLDEVVNEAVNATVDAMKWPVDFDGSINTGVRDLAAKTDMGLEVEVRESSRDCAERLSDLVRRMATRIREGSPSSTSAEPNENTSCSSTGIENAADQDEATCVYRRLQNRYEVLTRPAELQNVVLVAEKLPAPAEIALPWVRRHDWILAKVLLDESFRDALDTIGQDAADEQRDQPQRDAELNARRDRLYEHIRANILHYQRAIWQEEDPQQRSMRYRKSGRKVPLEWRFELEAGGALTIGELGERLAAPNVDGHFAAYSAGRQADLDQVIDPSGPLGYYGNYAIYHMRPEFASEDVFSMLHFFKSPYLWPNPDTGDAEVEDPVQIQISEDPAVIAPSDEVIDQHRDEMFRYLPELRAELARARKNVIDGTDPNAVEKLERQPGVLRRHFAAYLFRRERTRQMVLDTDGVVIDVIRSVAPPPEESGCGDGEIHLAANPDGYQLILEGERGPETLSANGHRNAEASWVIFRDGGEALPSLAAGAAGGAARAHESDADRLILSASRAGPRLTAVAGCAAAHAPQRMMLAGHDEERTPTLLAGVGAPHARDLVIRSRGDGERAPSLRAGRARDPESEPVILARGDGERMPGLLAGSGSGVPRAHPEADRAILARADEGLRLTALGGGGTAPAHERVILARDDEWLRPTPVAG